MDFDTPQTDWVMKRMGSYPWETTFVKLPIEFHDFNKDLLEPCSDLANDLDRPVLVGLSIGGLVGSYMKNVRKRIFVSPFWGFYLRKTSKIARPMTHLFGWSGTPVLPRYFNHNAIGEMCPAQADSYMPKTVSWRWAKEISQAQKELPHPDENDIVIYCPNDTVVDTIAIEKMGLDLIKFKGGHVFFCVKEREKVMHTIAEEVCSGFQIDPEDIGPVIMDGNG
jgi:hypothetical protein